MQKGFSLRNDEIALRNTLAIMERELHKPNQFQGKLNALSAQVLPFIQKQVSSHKMVEKMFEKKQKNPKEKEEVEKVKEFLGLQNQGLKELVNVVSQDVEDTKLLLSKKNVLKSK